MISEELLNVYYQIVIEKYRLSMYTLCSCKDRTTINKCQKQESDN